MDTERDAIAVVAHQIAILIRRAESARKTAETLDRSAYLLLDAIEGQSPLAIAVLAGRFQLDISTVSRQVAALEARGLVAREADPADGRVSLFTLTGEGLARLRAARAARQALFADLLEEWPDEDRRLLGVLLTRLNRAIVRQLGRRPAEVAVGPDGAAS